ncbi:MAG: hypothetical protein JXB47_14635 [Anaerolineae bacterium]|nr:hypothetical protein [Anaerolineae bacterium]
MPQIAKGGKWVFGWVVVGPDGAICVPPEAWQEYEFHAGDEVIFLPGSRRSGGFGLSTMARLGDAAVRLDVGRRALGYGRFDAGRRVTLPPDSGVAPGDRLLAVRGSGRALGFVAQGPIYEAALKYPGIEVFE